MPDFVSDGVRIRYHLAGPDDGVPTLLHHGYASDYQLNWVGSRWQDTLTRSGRLVVGLDARGHGQSDKPHDPAAYSLQALCEDVVNLLDHLGLGSTDFVGYSMGARVGLRLAIDRRERLHRAVLGGLGTVGGFRAADAIARRMLGDQSETDPVSETFHRFAAARPHNDLEALAAVMRAPRSTYTDQELGGITTPLLFITGSEDSIAGGSAELAAKIPSARYEELPGRNHTTAVPARAGKELALAFLDGG